MLEHEHNQVVIAAMQLVNGRRGDTARKTISKLYDQISFKFDPPSGGIVSGFIVVDSGEINWFYVDVSVDREDLSGYACWVVKEQGPRPHEAFVATVDAASRGGDVEAELTSKFGQTAWPKDRERNEVDVRVVERDFEELWGYSPNRL